MRILNTPLIPEQMESADRSPSPEFSPLAIGEDLTPLPAYKVAQTSSYNICGLLSTPLKLHEDLASGCGGQTWPAGMVLTKHMLRYHRAALKGARILELGAGGGLVGLAVALGCELQQTPLYLTDQDEMFELMGRNTELNNLQNKVKPFVLNCWCQGGGYMHSGHRILRKPRAIHYCAAEMQWELKLRRAQGGPLAQDVVDFKPNVILAADCVYFEPAFPLLLETLTNLLSLEPDATVYFCFKKRRRADMQFLKKAQKTFQVTEIIDDDRPIFSREGLFLYTFTSKKPTTSGNRQ
ncbi:hypothetical protein CH63R_08961 [Colletotrichum higginsianum IMI 349063]|uniref:Protein-lysine N-methyltransferase EFM6 n=1 Tax=Colletotrichum higginsianum (strain IMI 349063) TaxID=759273 RepID=A0A1B7Y5X2_COLHI|nr:hypothetical protein CH63R_08961 [Colletotrichum higginsianum IMI 349063]OBR07440.1 hypothetical protein CH63R_08961 [Colletotrichum higginsianum IMI 349063]